MKLPSDEVVQGSAPAVTDPLLFEEVPIGLGGAVGRGRWSVASGSTGCVVWLRVEASNSSDTKYSERGALENSDSSAFSRGANQITTTTPGSGLAPGSDTAKYELTMNERLPRHTEQDPGAGMGGCAMQFSSGQTGRSIHALLLPGLTSRFVQDLANSLPAGPSLRARHHECARRAGLLLLVLTAGLEASSRVQVQVQVQASGGNLSSGSEDESGAEEQARSIKSEMDAAVHSLAPGQGPWIHQQLDGSLDGSFSPALGLAPRGDASRGDASHGGACRESKETIRARDEHEDEEPASRTQLGFVFGKGWLQSAAVLSASASPVWVAETLRAHCSAADLMDTIDEQIVLRREMSTASSETTSWQLPEGMDMDLLASQNTCTHWNDTGLLREMELWGCTVGTAVSGAKVLQLPLGLTTSQAMRGRWRMRIAELGSFIRSRIGAADAQAGLLRAHRLHSLEQSVRVEAVTAGAVASHTTDLADIPMLEDLPVSVEQALLIKEHQGILVLPTLPRKNAVIVNDVLGAGVVGMLGSAAELVYDVVEEQREAQVRFNCIHFSVSLVKLSEEEAFDLQRHQMAEDELKSRARLYAPDLASRYFLHPELELALGLQLQGTGAGSGKSSNADRRPLPTMDALPTRYRGRLLAIVLRKGEEAYREAMAAFRSQPEGDEERALNARVQGAVSVRRAHDGQDPLGYNEPRRASDIVGLANIGSTCYANAAIASMLHTKSIRDVILGHDADLSADVGRAKAAAMGTERGRWGQRAARDYLRAANVVWELRRLFSSMLYGARRCQVPSGVLVSMAAVNSGNLDNTENFGSFNDDDPRHAVQAARLARREAQRRERARLVREHRQLPSQYASPDLGTAPPGPPRVEVLRRESSAGSAASGGRTPPLGAEESPGHHPLDDLPQLTAPILQRNPSNESGTSATSGVSLFSDSEVQSIASQDEEDGQTGDMASFKQLRASLGELMLRGSIEWNEAQAVLEGGRRTGLDQVTSCAPITRDGTILALQPPGPSGGDDDRPVTAAPGLVEAARLWRPLVHWRDQVSDHGGALAGESEPSGATFPEAEALLAASGNFSFGMNIQVLQQRCRRQSSSMKAATYSDGAAFLRQSDAGEFQNFLIDVAAFAMEGFERDGIVAPDEGVVSGPSASLPTSQASGTVATSGAPASELRSSLSHLKATQRLDQETHLVRVKLKESLTIGGKQLEAGTVLAWQTHDHPRGTIRWADPDCDWHPDAEGEGKQFMGKKLGAIQQWSWMKVPVAGAEEVKWVPHASSRSEAAAADGADAPPPGYGMTQTLGGMRGSVYTGIAQETLPGSNELPPKTRTSSDVEQAQAVIAQIQSQPGIGRSGMHPACTSIDLDSVPIEVEEAVTQSVIGRGIIASLPSTLTMVLGRSAPSALRAPTQLDYEIFMDDFIAPTAEFDAARQELERVHTTLPKKPSKVSILPSSGAGEAVTVDRKPQRAQNDEVWDAQGRSAVRAAQRALAQHRADNDTGDVDESLATLRQQRGIVQQQLNSLRVDIQTQLQQQRQDAKMDSKLSPDLQAKVTGMQQLNALALTQATAIESLQERTRSATSIARERELQLAVEVAVRKHARIRYRIRSVVIHDGATYESGHYYVFVRAAGNCDGAAAEDSTWIKYNDANVTSGLPWSHVKAAAEGTSGSTRSYLIVYERTESVLLHTEGTLPLPRGVAVVANTRLATARAAGLIREHIKQDVRCEAVYDIPPRMDFCLAPIAAEMNPFVSTGASEGASAGTGAGGVRSLQDMEPVLAEDLKHLTLQRCVDIADTVSSKNAIALLSSAHRRDPMLAIVSSFNHVLSCTGDALIAMDGAFSVEERAHQAAELADVLEDMKRSVITQQMPQRDREWVSNLGSTMVLAVQQLGRAISASLPTTSVVEGATKLLQTLSFLGAKNRMKGARAIVGARELASRMIRERAKAITVAALKGNGSMHGEMEITVGTCDLVPVPHGGLFDHDTSDEERRTAMYGTLHLTGSLQPDIGADAVHPNAIHFGLACQNIFRLQIRGSIDAGFLAEYPMTQTPVSREMVVLPAEPAGTPTKSGKKSTRSQVIRFAVDPIRCKYELCLARSDMLSHAEAMALYKPLGIGSDGTYSSKEEAIKADRAEQLLAACCSLRESHGAGREVLMLGPLAVPALALGPEACTDARRYMHSGTKMDAIRCYGAPMPTEINRLIVENRGGTAKSVRGAIQREQQQGRFGGVDASKVPAASQLSLVWCVVPESVLVQLRSVNTMDTSRIFPLSERQAKTVLGAVQYHDHAPQVGMSASPGSSAGGDGGMCSLQGRCFEPVLGVGLLRQVVAKRAGEVSPLVGRGLWLRSGSVGTRLADAEGMPLPAESGYGGACLSESQVPGRGLGEVAISLLDSEENASVTAQRSADRVHFVRRNRIEVWHAMTEGCGTTPCFDADRVEVMRQDCIKSTNPMVSGPSASPSAGSMDDLQDVMQQMVANMTPEEYEIFKSGFQSAAQGYKGAAQGGSGGVPPAGQPAWQEYYRPEQLVEVKPGSSWLVDLVDIDVQQM